MFFDPHRIFILLVLNCSRGQSSIAKVNMLEVLPHSGAGTTLSKPSAPGLLSVFLEGLGTEFGALLF